MPREWIEVWELAEKSTGKTHRGDVLISAWGHVVTRAQPRASIGNRRSLGSSSAVESPPGSDSQDHTKEEGEESGVQCVRRKHSQVEDY